MIGVSQFKKWKMAQVVTSITRPLGIPPELANVLAADATEESITGTTATQVKDMSFIIGVVNYASLTIEIELKTDNATNPAHCRVRHDGLGSGDLELTTSSTSYVILDGVIDTTAFSSGRHTIEFYLDDGSTETATIRETWVYGEE